MRQRRKYKKRSGKPIVAVRLNLQTDGFSYEKWGGGQRCKQGDWIVDNDGDCYTIDADEFERTYRSLGHGEYEKIATVMAEVAERAGSIKTLEGATAYQAGDYIVFNQNSEDGYAVSAADFEAMYEPAD